MTTFLSGPIEGFYGPPWTHAERLELFDWMAAWGLNTYVYAPKDDLKHRALWREPYSSSEAGALGQLIRACRQRGLRFVYGISPGLDIRYGDPTELERLHARFEQMLALGCRDFAVLFDDIPESVRPDILDRWGSLASAQCHVANVLFEWLRERSPSALVLVCPTAYCGRMVRAGLGGPDYLPAIGRGLLPDIDIAWTGPEVVSREITIVHVRDLLPVLQRKPVIWDNLHANDYDARRFFCGPYSGRPPALRGEVKGILSNPNTEALLNFVPLRTLADYTRSEAMWDARTAWRTAVREWLPRFATVTQPLPPDDLILFLDCYYLPHEEGPEAEALYERARGLLARKPESWGEDAAAFLHQAGPLRDLCAALAALRDRALFHALSRRAWELREEIDLLMHYVRARADGHEVAVLSDSHLPDTYRGGMVARLQRLLCQRPDGSFVPQSLAGGDHTLQDPHGHRRSGDAVIRPARPGDERGAYYVCLKTGDHGRDGERFYSEDPDALGRIYVGPYLAFEPELSLMLEDAHGICGYALGAFDSRDFYARYEAEWRPALCARFPEPVGDPDGWTRVQQIHHSYHHPDYFCPEPYESYPSHLHIDLLPRAQGAGYGRRMLEQIMDALRRRGSPGAHLGVSAVNTRAIGFYQRLGFRELTRIPPGAGDSAGSVYMGISLRD